MSRASTSWAIVMKKDVDGRDKPGHDEILALDSRPARLPRRASADTNAAHGRETEKTPETARAPAARACRSRACRDRGDTAHDRNHPRGVRALRFRAGGNPGDGIYRRARKIPA